jgi:hypothetical protein
MKGGLGHLSFQFSAAGAFVRSYVSVWIVSPTIRLVIEDSTFSGVFFLNYFCRGLMLRIRQGNTRYEEGLDDEIYYTHCQLQLASANDARIPGIR